MLQEKRSMLRDQEGVLDNSHIFCFTPSGRTRKLQHYLTWCGHYYSDTRFMISRDQFKDLLITYIQKGSFHLIYKNKTYIAKPGDIILLDYQYPHTYQTGPNTEFLFIHFNGSNSEEMCESLLEQNDSVIFNCEFNDNIFRILHGIFLLCLNNNTPSESERALSIYSILNYLQQAMENKVELQSPIAKAISYIERNTDRVLTLEEIADYVNLSPYYFAHKFKETIGHSPIEYSLNLKIEIAKGLISTTNDPIKSIAYEMGYSNVVSFINIFTRKTGIPPTRFRKISLRK